jgi:preprotein translocase subunit SecE
MALRETPCLRLLLLTALWGSSDALVNAPLSQRREIQPPLSRRAAAASWLRAPHPLMADGDADAAGGSPSQITEGGAPDLSQMTFEERLEYLSSQAPTEKAPKEEDSSSLFGIDVAIPSTQWWRPEFLKEVLEDLKDLQYPSRKQTFQTVVTSQIAFILVIISVLVLDATVEAFVRTLIQGQPFVISIDTILKQAPPQ